MGKLTVTWLGLIPPDSTATPLSLSLGYVSYEVQLFEQCYVL